MGRFINADGIVGANGGILGYNMFAYCSNNPVNFSDPSGNIALAIFGLVGVFVGVVAASGCSKKENEVIKDTIIDSTINIYDYFNNSNYGDIWDYINRLKKLATTSNNFKEDLFEHTKNTLNYIEEINMVRKAYRSTKDFDSEKKLKQYADAKKRIRVVIMAFDTFGSYGERSALFSSKFLCYTSLNENQIETLAYTMYIWDPKQFSAIYTNAVHG